MTSDTIERLQRVRLFLQDCIDAGHDRAMIGNLMSARDELDAAIAEEQAERSEDAPTPTGDS